MSSSWPWTRLRRHLLYILTINMHCSNLSVHPRLTHILSSSKPEVNYLSEWPPIFSTGHSSACVTEKLCRQNQLWISPWIQIHNFSPFFLKLMCISVSLYQIVFVSSSLLPLPCVSLKSSLQMFVLWSVPQLLQQKLGGLHVCHKAQKKKAYGPFVVIKERLICDKAEKKLALLLKLALN